jgi:hypothetical protein
VLQYRQKPCFSASPSCRPPSIPYVSGQWWRVGRLDQVRREATVRCTVQSTGFADSPKQCGAQDRQRAQWRGRIRPLCSMDLNVTSHRPPSPHIATGLHRADPFISRREARGGSRLLCAKRGFIGTGMFVVNEAFARPRFPARDRASAASLREDGGSSRRSRGPRPDRVARNSASESVVARPILVDGYRQRRCDLRRCADAREPGRRRGTTRAAGKPASHPQPRRTLFVVSVFQENGCADLIPVAPLE